LERQAELFTDLFGQRLSQATIVNANQKAYLILEPVAEKIKQ